MKVRWHTYFVDYKSSAAEKPLAINFNNSVDIAYQNNDKRYRDKILEFAAFLDEKGYIPRISFTELAKKYKNIYNEDIPRYTSPILLFVQTASWADLWLAYPYNWNKSETIDKENLVCNFTVDPVHNQGLVTITESVFGVPRVPVRTYHACCGLPEENPGCWTGEKKYKLVPYDPAPGFAEEVWDLNPFEPEKVEKLWISKLPNQGTKWIDIDYDKLHSQIIRKKEEIAKLVGIMYQST